MHRTCHDLEGQHVLSTDNTLVKWGHPLQQGTYRQLMYPEDQGLGLVFEF